MIWFSTDCLANWVESLPDEYNCVEDEEGIREATATRLRTYQEHIQFLEQRIDLAENVIGELYLMLKEVDGI